MRLRHDGLALTAIALTSLFAACGDDNKPKADTATATDAADVADTAGDVEPDADAIEETSADTADTTPDVETDSTADVETVDESLKVIHVWSADGATVYARFSDTLAAGTGADHFTLSGTAGTATITGLTMNDNDVMLTVSPALSTTSTYDLTVSGVRSTSGAQLPGDTWTGAVRATLFLNMVWHQHQPSYLDPEKGELQGPWVRKHAEKDYFDMTATVGKYPKVHLNVNLTSSLLTQLQRYTSALEPYVDVAADSVDESGFLAAEAHTTDPWVDLLLLDTPDPATMSDADKGYYWSGVWSMRSISEPLRKHFPEYEALVLKDGTTYTKMDLALLKVWFEVAWMDPDFLRGPVTVYKDGATDVVVDLSDVVTANGDGTYSLAAKYTDPGTSESARLALLETLANRLLAEDYKIMKGVFEVHKKLQWTGSTGQVEVLTTPFFHPILPLLFDTDLAKEGQPADPMPDPAFEEPGDVQTQIAMAVEYYTGLFGHAPRGMWPSEGAVAEEVVPAFVQNGIDWIATDRQVLDRGKPGASHLQPYMIDADTAVGDGGQTDDEMMIVFRDTEISDKVGFFYQSNLPVDNVLDFLVSVAGKAGKWGEPERLLSVILDGENAWEWYTKDHDGKLFLNGLYGGLEAAYDRGAIVTVTGSEYLDGNASRHVPAHPVTGLTEYEDLFPGSWVGGRLDTWIGETEENLGWNYLRTARLDIEAAKASLEPVIGMPTSFLVPPVSGASKIAWWEAWRALLSAEGSDWFWWYGSDQTSAGGNDTPFDSIFRSQLRSMYAQMNAALVAEGFDAMTVPDFAPIIQPAPVAMTGPFGTLPTLDGKIDPDPGEWVPPGGELFDNDAAGAIADPDDDIARVFYGYNKLEGGRIFVAIDLKEDLSLKLGTDYQLVVYTSQGHLVSGELVSDPFNTTTAEGETITFGSGGPARRIEIDFSGASPVATEQKADGAGHWTDVTATLLTGGPVNGGSVLELKFLLSDMGMANGDPLEIAVVAVQGGQALDTAPNLGAIIVFPDPTKLVTVIHELDATGSVVPLNQYVTLSDPPPPAGTGVVSITGNQDAYAQWTPNAVAMKDDGVAPDKVAGDHIWTIGFQFAPGTGLQYKFTIGHPTDSWGGTEEYPLTNRGYTVPADGTRRVRVRDVFADRPDPSGTMSVHTVVTVEE
ncbi:MAG: hypothetical protein U1F43_32220 [Myxococcota bacterium]